MQTSIASRLVAAAASAAICLVLFQSVSCLFLPKGSEAAVQVASAR